MSNALVRPRPHNEIEHPAATYGVFIPAYQAERTLASVVGRIPPGVLGRAEVVLIQDDASSDGTWEVARRMSSRDSRTAAVRHTRTLGFGGTNKAAFQRMLSYGVDAYAILHGDLQYEPERLEELLAPILAGEADIALGSRMAGRPLRGGMPIERWVANKCLTWLMNRRLGLRLTDFHTGFVALRCAAVRDLDVETMSDGHELTAELLIRAAARGLRILEVRIPTHYPPESRSCSRLTGARYAWNVIRMLYPRPRADGRPAEGPTERSPS